MSDSRDLLLDQGYLDVAPEMAERLFEVFGAMQEPGNYSAFSKLNSQYAGHTMHVAGIRKLDNPSTNAWLFKHPYEKNPLLPRLQNWKSQFNLRRLQAKVEGRRADYSGIHVDDYRWATDDSGAVIPMTRVDEFTARLVRLPNEHMEVGVFSKLGNLVAFNTLTAKMFDQNSFEPLVEVYDLGV
ncbi:MAG: hypothetical protein ACI9T8_000462 [Candidatus Saccharimonadales bacterium]|jgi:hypothetical protein